MRKRAIQSLGVIGACFMVSALLMGCATTHEATKQVGYTAGQGMRTAGGLTEGAAEGYQYDSKSRTNNPYNR